MTYKTIHTAYGLSKLAAAEVSGVPIVLTEMAVGDGNGNPTTPDEGQTDLVRELYRATINRVFKPDPTGAPNKFTAELLVPATAGGFVLREVGVFDADGGLFAVGNLPDTYKPTASEGAVSDTVVRVEFYVTNADVVTLQIDPNVAVASQTWVINYVATAALIPGGTTGQILTKTSNADGGYDWESPDDINVVVDTIEEEQTLAADQTDVILATVTTNGLAVYIDGVRISQGAGANQWEPDVTDPDTTLELGQSYAAGTKILMVQNEPAGAVPFPLIRDQNLADVPDKAAARTNLGVYSKEETDAKAPASLVAHFARATAPTGWLKANGAAISRTAYAALFDAIGTAFGAGDGFNTFNLPDLRGEFLRGWDDSRGVDFGRGFGSVQLSQNLSHGHGVNDPGHGHGVNDPGHSHGVNDPGHLHSITDLWDNGGINGAREGSGVQRGDAYTNRSQTGISISGAGAGISVAGNGTGISVAAHGGSEARPRNVALLACIKY